MTVHNSTDTLTAEMMTIGAAAPSTFSNEAAGADGGFAIPPQFRDTLLTVPPENVLVRPRATGQGREPGE